MSLSLRMSSHFIFYLGLPYAFKQAGIAEGIIIMGLVSFFRYNDLLALREFPLVKQFVPIFRSVFCFNLQRRRCNNRACNQKFSVRAMLLLIECKYTVLRSQEQSKQGLLYDSFDIQNGKLADVERKKFDGNAYLTGWEEYQWGVIRTCCPKLFQLLRF